MSTPDSENNPNSLQIAVKASNGKYVTVDAEGASALQASAASAGEWQTFEMIRQGDLTMALRAANGKYVRTGQDGTIRLEISSDTIGAEELFALEPIDDTRVAVVASNGKYVSNVDNGARPLQANQDTVGSNEIFSLEHLGTQELQPAPTPPATARVMHSAAASDAAPQVYTVCLCGTACTRDEGEVTRKDSNKEIYSGRTGYIPVRMHLEIAGTLKATTPSITVRGVGENDWANSSDSEPLVLDGPLNADKTLLNYCKPYSGGNQYSKTNDVNGWPMPALALHAANLAAQSGAGTINLVGHSRGAVEAIMAAWFLYAYGSADVRKIPVNIFAIDPVPGPGDWYSIITQLPPNVASYVGVYAWDMCVMATDKFFMADVPRPNGRMLGKPHDVKPPSYSYWPWNPWKYLAYTAQERDPLAPASDAQPSNYELFACRGRHSTLAGNATSNGEYDPKYVADAVKPVPDLIYRMARAYLTEWGVNFSRPSAVTETALALRRQLNIDHRLFDAMGGGATRTSSLPDRPYVRRVSSIMGSNPFSSYYMDNVVGDPPYTMAYPVTNERKDAGWVNWKFL
jgi:Fascin domain-containing protein